MEGGVERGGNILSNLLFRKTAAWRECNAMALNWWWDVDDEEDDDDNDVGK